MITADCFATEPWALTETPLNMELLPQSESVFALSNGHVGWRGNLDEGEPHGMPGTYLNGFHELHPLPYSERAHGYPESGQTAINVTNGKVIRLLVDDTPFDLRYGRLLKHERVLDLRAGQLQRECEWKSPAGHTIRVRAARLVSFTQRAIAAVAYEVEAIDTSVAVVVQSELIANEELPTPANDPRTAVALTSPLDPEDDEAVDNRLRLIHRTRRSGLRVATAADHVVEGPPGTRSSCESKPDVARLTVTSRLAPGQKLRIEKTVAYGWSGVRSLPALRDQVEAALVAAADAGWRGLATEQRRYLDEFWARSDVEVDGDAELQQAVRFALFHVLQAGARAEECALPSKGLTGTGYDGHSFWDTEIFVLPLLIYTSPDGAAEALRWRQRTLPQARIRARQLGLRGAAFPWRTIDGSECSAYWPAGTAAFHINAGIADAVARYVSATGDAEFGRTIGLELLVETARLWMSLGHFDAAGAFHIDGVTGPDEYSAIKDDNLYTNLMAGRNLRAAAETAARWHRETAAMGVGEKEVAAWIEAAKSVHVPYSECLGVHEQHAGFTRQERWNFEETRFDQYPLMLHFPYFDIYRKQVVKQADLILAMYTCGDSFSAEQKERNFAYYESCTVRDSSLSACCQAIIAAEVGHDELAYEYVVEAALMDLRDLEHNTRDGLHIASLAGTWMALACGFGGMRHNGDVLSFRPGLPDNLTRLAFHIRAFDCILCVEISADGVKYTLEAGSSMTIQHYDESLSLVLGSPFYRSISKAPRQAAPAQPAGRPPGRPQVQDEMYAQRTDSRDEESS
ncbi:glycoside hydrolase family 65 protein [Streptomyces rubrogriseus]|uniref:glycoside hydrolase family 65 protein n=1 Tax=Streptomyces rubrogriseus TaxID=194673 RepID=UPI000D5956A5|nr:glycosyl hydrolase family 65 protein [Streptomyces rubrogriseus]